MTKSAIHSWQEVFDAEKAYLDARRGGTKRPYATGIALSGGGIRSAAVSLGMLQVLAGARLIRHFDYLSTVSGGGYTGCALALRLAQAAREAGAATPGPDDDGVFPYGRVTATGMQDSAELEHIRHNADYLAPHGFGSLATGFFIVARSILLNLFIWITIGGIFFALAMWAAAWLDRWLWYDPYLFLGVSPERYFFMLLLWGALACLGVLALGVAGVSISSWWIRAGGKRGKEGQPWSDWRWWVFIVAAVGWSVWAWQDRPPPSGPASSRFPDVSLTDAVQLIPGVLLLLAIFVPVLSQVLARWGDPDLRRHPRPISAKYARRRVQEKCAGILLTLAVALGVIGAIPFLSDMLGYFFGSGGAGTGGLGQFLRDNAVGTVADRGTRVTPLPLFLIYLGSAAAALVGYYNGHLRGRFGVTTAVVVILGSILLVFGALLIAYQVGLRLYDAGNPWGWLSDSRASNHLATVSLAVTAGAAMVAIILAIFVNINDMSLQRFYRDRLMEAFMPDMKDGEALPGPATVADRYNLDALVPESLLAAGVARPPGGSLRKAMRWVKGQAPPAAQDPPPIRHPIGPYPLINTYLLARRYQGGPERSGRAPAAKRDLDLLARRIGERRGDSFLMTPLFIGSTLTQWKRTAEMIGDQLTLPTAMAVSGAAINPGGGLAGRGVTTNYATALAMSLLSLRLGYQMRWSRNIPAARLRRALNPYGNHVLPGATELAAEVLGRRSTDDPPFIELSDGGHFDNLGLYELVRRRCRLILICDGGEDPTGSYEAFVSVMMMIREDFGVEIRFDSAIDGKMSGPAQLVARSRDDEYPKAADFAERGYFLATLRYARHEGTLDASREVPAEEETGLVVYLKAAMLRSLGLPSRGYKGAHPEFPYEPTSDQFFTPEQFSAYRDVGNQITLQMLRETNLASFFGKERPDLEGILAAFTRA